MKLIYVFKIFVLCSACFTIEVYNYYKPVDKQTAWKIEENKDYTPKYNSITHSYNSCDSLSSIKIEFTNTIKSVLTGPPIIPIFPGGFLKSRYLQVSISIKTNNFNDLSEVPKNIILKINDTLDLKPFYSIIHNSNKTIDIDFHKSICDTYSVTNNTIWFLNRYDIYPGDVKTIEVIFNDELNNKLRSKHQNLKLKSKKKWKYCPLFFYMT